MDCPHSTVAGMEKPGFFRVEIRNRDGVIGHTRFEFNVEELDCHLGRGH